MKQKQKLLLIEDVDDLGRSGEIVSAKPGYARNYLIPQKKGVIADKHTLKMQARLQEERAKLAAVDRKEAEDFAASLAGFVLVKEVKVDPEGNMYGSVSSLDIARMMQEKGFPLERRHILLPQPLKTVGVHTISLRLKEGVTATFQLEILGEGASVEEVLAKEEKTA